MIRSKIIELAVERMGIEENCSDADAADSMYVDGQFRPGNGD